MAPAPAGKLFFCVFPSIMLPMFLASALAWSIPLRRI